VLHLAAERAMPMVTAPTNNDKRNDRDNEKQYKGWHRADYRTSTVVERLDPGAFSGNSPQVHLGVVLAKRRRPMFSDNNIWW
jgi:hypothetical protein